MPRLLLVEDNADNRDLMEAMLGEHFDLSLAADGREALERIELGPPFDLFLFDYFVCYYQLVHAQTLNKYSLK